MDNTEPVKERINQCFADLKELGINAVCVFTETDTNSVMRMYGEPVDLARLLMRGTPSALKTIQEKLGLSDDEFAAEVLQVPQHVRQVVNDLVAHREKTTSPPLLNNNFGEPSLLEQLTKKVRF